MEKTNNEKYLKQKQLQFDTLDKNDIRVLASLRDNAREKLVKISRNIDLPVSTIYDRMVMLEREVIKKKTVLLNLPKIGYNTRAIIVMKVKREQRAELKKFLTRCKNMNNLLKINNGYDYLVEVVFKHVKDLEDFLEDLDEQFKLLEKNVYYIIDDLERESFLSQERLGYIID